MGTRYWRPCDKQTYAGNLFVRCAFLARASDCRRWAATARLRSSREALVRIAERYELRAAEIKDRPEYQSEGHTPVFTDAGAARFLANIAEFVAVAWRASMRVR